MLSRGCPRPHRRYRQRGPTHEANKLRRTEFTYRRALYTTHSIAFEFAQMRLPLMHRRDGQGDRSR